MSAAPAVPREIASPHPGVAGLGDRSAERRARADLRRQIAALERRLSRLFASSFPRRGIDWGIGAAGGPRVLGIGELERVRDALALRLREAERELAERRAAERDKRALLDRMIAEPERHRWVIISNDDIGERGCRHWHSRPRWGLLGMLLGWWRVKLSSGCPLATGHRPPALRVTRKPDGEEAPQATAATTATRGVARSRRDGHRGRLARQGPGR